MSDCTDCGKEAEKLAEPVRWLTARVWYAADNWFAHINLTPENADLPDDPLGYVGVRSSGTTDSGCGEWYESAWRGTPDWRLQVLQSDAAKEDAERKRPDSIFRRGRFVPDRVMDAVTAEMSAYQRSLR